MERRPGKAARELAAAALFALVGSIGAPAWAEAHGGSPLLGPDTAGPIEVVRGPCPADGGAIGCADPQSRTIWVAARGPGFPAVLEHERGHVLSYWQLAADERAQIGAAAGWSVWHEERFADAFATCRLSARQRRRVRALAGFSIGTLDPAVCRLIAEFATSPAQPAS
jgi:hypothetical protein